MINIFIAEHGASKKRSYALGECIGFLAFRIDHEPNYDCKELYVYEFMMDRQYSQQGFGTYLLDLCQFIAKTKKCRHIGLTCFATNPALEFYDKSGFIVDQLNEDIEKVDTSDYRLLLRRV